MSNIIGDAKLIKRVREAGPADKSIYVNMDAIEQLPDEYEVVLTEVSFDPRNLKGSFSDVGNKTWMPSPEMHYRIAEAKGISGGDASIVEPIYEEVNYSDMTMEPVPSIMKMLVGYRCKKFSTVLEEDGTERRSSACEIQYNVWNRCQELWAKEEMYTEGYTKQGKYPPKYDTRWKRKAHFTGEMKFAQQKAETKAHEKTIREIAGLMTGYQEADLKSGSLVFAKVRRSRKVLQMETAARLGALSKGMESQPAALLYGGDPEPVPEQKEAEPVTIEQPSKRDQMIATLEFYVTEDLTAPEDPIDKILEWLKNHYEETDTATWDKALYWLTEVEKRLDDSQKLTHTLY